MNGSDSARVRANPRHRIGSRFQTSADIKLQDYGWLRVLRQYFDGALAFDGGEFGLDDYGSPSLNPAGSKLVGGGV